MNAVWPNMALHCTAMLRFISAGVLSVRRLMADLTSLRRSRL